MRSKMTSLSGAIMTNPGALNICLSSTRKDTGKSRKLFSAPRVTAGYTLRAST